jgi:hypothetical protein
MPNLEQLYLPKKNTWKQCNEIKQNFGYALTRIFHPALATREASMNTAPPSMTTPLNMIAVV